MFRDLCNLKQKEAVERFHSFHTSYRKIRQKKQGCILALESKTHWGSVFNLEDKTVCHTGVGAFVGHRNRLSSTENIFKRNCPRLRAKPLYCSGSWVTQEE